MHVSYTNPIGFTNKEVMLQYLSTKIYAEAEDEQWYGENLKIFTDLTQA